MTDPRPRRPGRPSPAPIVLGAWVAFLAVFILLALQLRAGRDPALGAPKPVAAAPDREVVVRRIHRRVIVTTILPPRPSATPTRTPAPATSTRSAPAPAPAPAPAAPVTTHSS